MTAASFFFRGISVPSWVYGTTAAVVIQLPSDLGDLAELELDRRFPAKDGDQYLEPLSVDVDLGDRRRQRRERPVLHSHRLPDLELLRLRRLDLLLLLD